jgi:hypothetical protein
MIDHKNKLIFVHVPKCGGSSIERFFLQGVKFEWETPNYDILYGWCPKRRIHLQHATATQLLDTELICDETWNSYYKFAFVRNPWDRAYSDYLWFQKELKIRDSFRNFLTNSGNFSQCLTDNSDKFYRGDHLYPQSDYFSEEGLYSLDYIGRFEHYADGIAHILNHLKISTPFEIHLKEGKYKGHYSRFYTKSRKRLVDSKYVQDIQRFNYSFEDRKSGLKLFKKLI